MIKKETKSFLDKDNVNITYQIWRDTEVEIKGLLQIIHGYAEWVDRYHEFASFMAKNGFIVFGEDHRGHGHTRAKNTNVIHFDINNGFEKVVNDNHELTMIMKKNYTDKPIIILGHSMGSFILRRYIQKYSNEICASIICGTGNNPLISLYFANIIAKLHIFFRGAMNTDYLLDKLVFGQLNSNYKNSKTGLDWICRDKNMEYKMKFILHILHSIFINCNLALFKLLYIFSTANYILYNLIKQKMQYILYIT